MKSNSRKFDSEQYIQEYLQLGTFPKIHDDIFKTITDNIPVCKLADFGASTGLLSIRLSEQGYECHAIEPTDTLNAMKDDKIKTYKFKIGPDTMDQLQPILSGCGLVVARRVFPEIADSNGIDFIKKLAQFMYDNKVKYIALEGRIESSKSVNALSTANKECQALAQFYKPVFSYKNCRILKMIPQ